MENKVKPKPKGNPNSIPLSLHRKLESLRSLAMQLLKQVEYRHRITQAEYATLLPLIAGLPPAFQDQIWRDLRAYNFYDALAMWLDPVYGLASYYPAEFVAIAEKFLGPGFGERELEQRIKLLLEDLKFEKENLGKLPESQIEKYLAYYKANANTSWSYLKSLGITIDPSPAKFEEDISTWSLEEQAIAWKTYNYNILSKIGQTLYDQPYIELAKTLGLAAIIGLTTASVIKKLIEEWKKPPTPPQAKGTLRVQSDPANAEVYVDGTKVGNAGSLPDGSYRDYLITAGLHIITFKLANYRDRTYSVDVIADQINFVPAVLFPITLPSAVRYITPAGARGNVNELWFDVMPEEKKVAHYEKGELTQIIEITKEYLDFVYQWNPNAWRHCFEIYWGHPYEYYYPPPQPAPTTFTLDLSTQDLAGYLVVGSATAALGWLAYDFIAKASLAAGAYAGATLLFSKSIYNVWGDKLVTWAESAFPEYNIAVEA